MREAVLAFNGDVQVEAFSSLKKLGVDKLRQKLDSWFSELAPIEEAQDGEYSADMPDSDAVRLIRFTKRAKLFFRKIKNAPVITDWGG